MQISQLPDSVWRMGEHSILLIDDDVELCALMTEYFGTKGYAIECAHNGRDGLARALENRHSLIILDGMLPVLDGFEVLRQLRKRASIPVIMLTARAQEHDRITGLDIGADDYLPKPFGPDELLARMCAVLRRYNHGHRSPQELLRVGPIELDPGNRLVRRSGEIISLTAIELQILELLMRSTGRVVSRNEIAVVLYQREATPYERSLDVHMSHLRRKIEKEDGLLIRTVRGVGYVLTEGEA
jgi:two-component system, OmpR family, response regulator CpxR